MECSGAPDVMTLRARSANLRSQRYRATTCGAIVNQLAGRHSLTPKCHPDLASQSVDIDGTDWIVVSADHRLGDNGFTTAQELECKPAGAGSAPEGDADETPSE